MQNGEQETQFCIINSSFCIRKIAIFRALFLGDLLCATPALRAIKRRFPQAEVTLIGLPWAAELVRRLPYVDRLEIFPGYPNIVEVPVEPGRTRAFLEAARAYGYDLAIQMHGSGSVSNGFVADLGAKLSLGYRSGEDNRLTVSLPYDEDEHEILRWLRLVDTLQFEAQPPQSTISIDFPIAAEEHARAAALLPAGYGAPLVGLHVGAKDPTRRWPPERFAALAGALADRYDAEIVLTGAAQERDLTAAVRRAMRRPPLDLAGATDLGTFAAVIARLDLLISNDTGAAHIAAATGTRSVIVYGFTRPANWAPLNRALHRPIDARELAGAAADPTTALAWLPIEPVLVACEEMLEQTNDQRPMTNDQRPRGMGNQQLDVEGRAIEVGRSSLVLGPSSTRRS